MKYFIPLVFLIFSAQSFAEDKARPSPHNKIGHTKKSQAEKEKSFNPDIIYDGTANPTKI